uniref:Glycerate kinase n=1 Tax=Syphacia muris TaxID=451379 RepID=A0A0N5AWV5_9BILA
MFELRNACLSAFRSSVKAVQPYNRVRSTLKVADGYLSVGKQKYKLNSNVYIAAFGKAGLGMVQGAEDVLGSEVVKGIASVPRNSLQKLSPGEHLITNIYEGATNNLPDEDSLRNAKKIEDMAKSLTANDLFLVLISGGGSALLSAPVESISLSEKLATIKAMTSRGADIKQLNTVRIALSRLKGGKLAALAKPAKVLSLIISDIVGDPLELIASGPTVIPADDKITSTPVQILKDLSAWNSIPKNVQDVLKSSSETFDAQQKLVNNQIISNNETAISGLEEFFKNVGYSSHKVSNTIAKNAQIFGKELASVVKAVISGDNPVEQLKMLNFPDMSLRCSNSDRFALLFGGECTVTLTGNGKGGRNQEIVLKAVSELLSTDITKSPYDFVLMSAGTDGQDGPTEVAGVVFTSDDLLYMQSSAGWNKQKIDEYLNKNDSYNFWKIFRNGLCHVITGPTGTNVMDVQVLLFSKKVSH